MEPRDCDSAVRFVGWCATDVASACSAAKLARRAVRLKVPPPPDPYLVPPPDAADAADASTC